MGRVYDELLRQMLLQERLLWNSRARILAEGGGGDVSPALQDHCPGIARRASCLHPMPQISMDPGQPALPRSHPGKCKAPYTTPQMWARLLQQPSPFDGPTAVMLLLVADILIETMQGVKCCQCSSFPIMQKDQHTKSSAHFSGFIRAPTLRFDCYQIHVCSRDRGCWPCSRLSRRPVLQVLVFSPAWRET